MVQRIVSTFLFFVCAATLALAQPPRTPMQSERVQGPHEAILRKLNLTEAQESQVKKLRIEMMKKQAQLHSRIQVLRLDSKELFLADKVDRKALESNIKSITDQQEQLKLNMVDFWFGVNSLLTPDQQRIWKKVPMELGEQVRGNARRMMRERFEDDGPDFH